MYFQETTTAAISYLDPNSQISPKIEVYQIVTRFTRDITAHSVNRFTLWCRA